MAHPPGTQQERVKPDSCACGPGHPQGPRSRPPCPASVPSRTKCVAHPLAARRHSWAGSAASPRPAGTRARGPGPAGKQQGPRMGLGTPSGRVSTGGGSQGVSEGSPARPGVWGMSGLPSPTPAVRGAQRPSPGPRSCRSFCCHGYPRSSAQRRGRYQRRRRCAIAERRAGGRQDGTRKAARAAQARSPVTSRPHTPCTHTHTTEHRPLCAHGTRAHASLAPHTASTPRRTHRFPCQPHTL